MNFEETHMYYGLKGAFGFAGVESRYYLISFYLGSMLIFIAVLSSPSISISSKAGMHIKS